MCSSGPLGARGDHRALTLVAHRARDVRARFDDVARCLLSWAFFFLRACRRRLDESTDCSQRPEPVWLSGGAGGGGDGEGDAIGDDDMGDFMAEILAEEVRGLWFLRGNWFS